MVNVNLKLDFTMMGAVVSHFLVIILVNLVEMGKKTNVILASELLQIEQIFQIKI